ncbi:RsiW-degrading membrane proteinase PrsW (M82 family) [Prosthecobacter fusiformis]|uniref:RsiW-degrading membrane proteinase PrsW (M82 family) n=1 Tax=Prosthecobacter fusiformis TaxID=48464 RepID=A0A4V3FIA6_9BACT|nr:PrsW family glutamic-type intramembrane protease [Prosthecobacter fusiformis]TDU81733.1 RsiW-degrading membrane proteinase PrsW (M82 family) [Prosthecobacter fusiformis]
MIHGWRSQIHYWSRNSGFLKRLALAIATAGFLLSLLIIVLTPDASQFTSTDPLEQKLRTEWQVLNRADKPTPHELVRWLHHATDNIHHLCSVLGIKTTTWDDYKTDGRLAGHEVRPLLEKHSADPAVVLLWENYIQASLNRDVETSRWLSEQAALPAPLITAPLIESFQLAELSPSRSLAALMREATLFPSPLVREAALHTALVQKDLPAMRLIADQPDWWSTMPAQLRRAAASELGDFRLQLQSMLAYRFILEAPGGTLAVALLAAAIWYVILVLHGLRGTWRWVFPLLPLLAGIFSVWPVFFISSWQEFTLGMKEDGPFPQDLWYQIGGVGMREELCKLLFASLFMPWLLIKRPAGGALMIGAFVGLGFALEENIGYYLRGDDGVPLTRFFTANFFHAALTGISTHAFYQLWRSRFGTADRFIITFLGVVVAHGAYNFGYSDRFADTNAYLSIIILAFVAWHFLDLVDQECPPGRQWLSPAAVFLVGTASLMAVIFLSIAIRTPDRHILVLAATQCISMFPIAFIYWRRLSP